MDDKIVEEIAKQAGLELDWEGWTSPTPDNKYPECVTEEALKRFYELAFIAGMQEQMRRSVDRAVNAQADAAFRERLAQAIEQMPFGDTATSFATFVRNFK